MIRFLEGQAATVKVSVASSIDTTGFTVSAMLGSAPKTISSIQDGGTYQLEFSASDIAHIPYDPVWGTVSVLDSNGDTYQKMMVEIQKVPANEPRRASGSYTLPIVLAANWVGGSDGGGGSSNDYVKKSAFDSIATPDNSINGNNVAIKDILIAAKK